MIESGHSSRVFFVVHARPLLSLGLWKKSGAIFASFDGLCGCQDQNPRVHLLFVREEERGPSMTLSYPQGAWNILASQAGVVVLGAMHCSIVQLRRDHRGSQPFCVS